LGHVKPFLLLLLLLLLLLMMMMIATPHRIFSRSRNLSYDDPTVHDNNAWR